MPRAAADQTTQKVTIRPLADRVIVRRAEAESKSPGGIILADVAKEKPCRGEVLAVGPGKEREDGSRRPMDVRVGDVVWFGKYTGSEIVVGGDKLYILREEDILGTEVSR